MLMMNSLEKNDTLRVNYASFESHSSHAATLPRQDSIVKMTKPNQGPNQSYPLIPNLNCHSAEKTNRKEVIYPMKTCKKGFHSRNKSVYTYSSRNFGVLKIFEPKICNFMNNNSDNI